MHAHGCFCVGSLLGKHGILSFDLRLAANPFDLSAHRCLARPAKRTLVLGYSWAVALTYTIDSEQQYWTKAGKSGARYVYYSGRQ